MENVAVEKASSLWNSVPKGHNLIPIYDRFIILFIFYIYIRLRSSECSVRYEYIVSLLFFPSLSCSANNGGSNSDKVHIQIIMAIKKRGKIQTYPDSDEQYSALLLLLLFGIRIGKVVCIPFTYKFCHDQPIVIVCIENSIHTYI